ncbi:MAG: hypothetical protein IPL17_09995 [Anaerolineales bacterium]|nr:hypothetical protein [Anaerolineales bacterium]
MARYPCSADTSAPEKSTGKVITIRDDDFDFVSMEEIFDKTEENDDEVEIDNPQVAIQI